MKYLVVLFNNTNETIHFVNTEHSGDNQTLNAKEAFRTDKHFDIPDNSEPSQYFEEHHMEIQDQSGQPLFSFWGDDHDDYRLKYCPKQDWRNSQDIPGYPGGENFETVGIILEENKTLKAFKVNNDV